MRGLDLRLTVFLLVSGSCALAYQMAWFRELRLVFGASTASSAAVLAIFMAGLGAGSLLLGRYGDRVSNPLMLYGNLEVGIAVTAGLSPWILQGVQWSYLALGGTTHLGSWGGNLARLALATLVLGVPTFLMGGTLPAAVRAAIGAGDRGRRSLGRLYAANTLGAVIGTTAATFLLLEHLGQRRTLWVAALLNLLVAIAARATARRLAAEGRADEADEEAGSRAVAPAPAAPLPGGAVVPSAPSAPSASIPPAAAPVPLVLTAALVVGFVFFLMELVWYRMLAPILGGSTYTFGIILAVALLGIGTGGLLYGLGARSRRPTLMTFAGTCALEALALAIPLALGYRVALLAQTLRGLQAEGFSGLVLGWGVVAALVVLPASVVAGYQFPLLVAVLGSGRPRVARQVGQTYAWNTVGAIAGALAGGFGLIPWLTAPGAWRLAILLLLLLAAACAVVAWRRGATLIGATWPVAAGALAALLLLAPGPDAYWRHGQIGAGRGAPVTTPNELRAELLHRSRMTLWEADGLESSVALQGGHGYSFAINGKTDGHARTDAPTQVMSTLVGAALHPAPRRGLVVGLGTGSSAGWLADVETVERVDVVELEPAVLRVAEACAPVNRRVLEHPKVRVILGDARELLLTTRERYDLIFSEPSNPYRAGIASLFTREFYAAVTEILEPGGVFLQWLQAYEVDAELVQTVYATLASVFPHVETWEVHRGDLLLVASLDPVVHDLERISARVEEEPIASALRKAWGVSGAAGLYTGYVGGDALASSLADSVAGRLNTDDRTVMEYGVARTLGRRGLFSIDELRFAAAGAGDDWPSFRGAEPDREEVVELMEVRFIELGGWPPRWDAPPGAAAARRRARNAYVRGDLPAAAEEWLGQEESPRAPMDLLLVAESLAEVGDAGVEALVERLRVLRPVEADAVLARFHYASGDLEGASRRLQNAFAGYRRDPWPPEPLMQRALDLAFRVAMADPGQAGALFDALAEPFAVAMFDDIRRINRIRLTGLPPLAHRCAEAFEAFEPYPQWQEGLLRGRAQCYRDRSHPLARRAERDLARFLRAHSPRLVELLDHRGEARLGEGEIQ